MATVGIKGLNNSHLHRATANCVDF